MSDPNRPTGRPSAYRSRFAVLLVVGSTLAIAAGVYSFVAHQPAGSPGTASGTADKSHGLVAVLDLGLRFQQQDSLEQADSCFRMVIEKSKSQGDSAMLARGLLSRARLNLSLDLYQRAEPDLREAVRLGRVFGAMPPMEQVGAYLSLAECCENQNQISAADSAGDSAVAFMTRAGDSEPMLRVRALVTSGRIKIKSGHPAQAEAHLREAMHLCDHSFSPLGQDSWEAKSLWGWSLVRLGRYTEAEPNLLRVYAHLYSELGDEDPRVRETAGYLAELYDRLGKPDLFGHYQSVSRQGRMDEFGN